MSSGYPDCELCGAQSILMFEKFDKKFIKCRSCGLEWITPRPKSLEIESLYGKSYYDSWGLGNSSATEMMKRATFSDKLDMLESVAAPVGRILDIGCATGFFLDVARQRGWDPYGVDLSPYSSQIARNLIGHDRIRTGQLGEAGFSDGYFDVIFMTDVIEHVDALQEFVSEVTRILKPGGLIAITTPDPSSLSRTLLRSHWPHYKLEHLRYFTKEALLLALKPSGFEPLLVSEASKTLTPAYFALQMKTYPVPVVSPCVASVAALLPDKLLKKQFRLLTGELFLLARRGLDMPQ